MALFGLLGYVCVSLAASRAADLASFSATDGGKPAARDAASRGDPWVFISPSKPISMGFLIARWSSLVTCGCPPCRKKREEVFV